MTNEVAIVGAGLALGAGVLAIGEVLLMGETEVQDEDGGRTKILRSEALARWLRSRPGSRPFSWQLGKSEGTVASTALSVPSCMTLPPGGTANRREDRSHG